MVRADTALPASTANAPGADFAFTPSEAVELPTSFLGLEVTETAIVQEGHAGDRARAELRERVRGVASQPLRFRFNASSAARTQKLRR